MTKRIAVIDDDEVFQLIIQKQLEMKGLKCDVLKFKNGQEATDFFTQDGLDHGQLPDLVLLDVNMPIKDGWGFLADYKELSQEIKSKVNLYMVTSSVIQSLRCRASVLYRFHCPYHTFQLLLANADFSCHFRIRFLSVSDQSGQSFVGFIGVTKFFWWRTGCVTIDRIISAPTRRIK